MCIPMEKARYDLNASDAVQGRNSSWTFWSNPTKRTERSPCPIVGEYGIDLNWSFIRTKWTERKLKLTNCSGPGAVFLPLTLARTGGLVHPPPWGFSRIAKKRRRVAPPGFGVPYGANLAQFVAKKNWPGQVRSRSYDVIRGTTSGNFSNKVVFSRNLTWRHWCKW